jgi:hypothetical protein
MTTRRIRLDPGGNDYGSSSQNEIRGLGAVYVVGGTGIRYTENVEIAKLRIAELSRREWNWKPKRAMPFNNPPSAEP